VLLAVRRADRLAHAEITLGDFGTPEQFLQEQLSRSQNARMSLAIADRAYVIANPQSRFALRPHTRQRSRHRQQSRLRTR